MLWGVGSGGWSGGGRESALPFSVEAMPTGPSVGWTLGSRQEESLLYFERTNHYRWTPGDKQHEVVSSPSEEEQELGSIWPAVWRDVGLRK